jgi:hypothetical protein
MKSLCQTEFAAADFTRSDFGNAVVRSNVFDSLSQYRHFLSSQRENPLHCALFCATEEKPIEAVTDVALSEGFSRSVVAAPRSRKSGETWGTPVSGIPVSGTPVHPDRFWQARFYDFNVWTEGKRIEKLRYIHRNPVERGLVSSPEQWRWSSFRWYLYGEAGPSAHQ